MYIVLTADDKFNGVVYDASTPAIYDHHDQYGEAVVYVATVPAFDPDNLQVVANAEALRLAAFRDRLWKAAKQYQLDKLDDAGYGEMKDKATAGGTKALANVNWVKSIWNEYYVRRSLSTHNFDFSSMGNPPFDFYDAYQQ